MPPPADAHEPRVAANFAVLHERPIHVRLDERSRPLRRSTGTRQKNGHPQSAAYQNRARPLGPAALFAITSRPMKQMTPDARACLDCGRVGSGPLATRPPHHRTCGRASFAGIRGRSAESGEYSGLRKHSPDAAIWPDTIKDPLYEDGDTPLFRLVASGAGHLSLHQCAVPGRRIQTRPRPGARPTDILQMTRECLRVLRGTSKAFTPREALRMLAHLVGDMHQPLHAATPSSPRPARSLRPSRWPDRLAHHGRRQRARLRAAGSLQPPLLLGHAHRQPRDAERRRQSVCVEARGGSAGGRRVEGHRQSRHMAGALGQRCARLRAGRA